MITDPLASSLSLATRYRPSTFADVLGQLHVTEVLRRAVEANTLPQQLLFSGRSGLGKTTIARIVAAALLCETDMSKRTRGDVCGTCSSCLLVTNGAHPDIIEFDAASHGGKDEIRDIAARSQVAPMLSKFKVYIIDEAHGLSTQGGQAFLKLLEEPPAHVFFMLCTTDPQKMLKTNRGRCVEFELLTPAKKEMYANLVRICTGEDWNGSEDILNMVLDASDPELGVRGTVTTLAKLGSVLKDKNISIDTVATLLGTPSPIVLAKLFAAFKKGDRQLALKELGNARRQYSDTILRSSLVQWASAQVTGALDSSQASLARALWELETVLDMQDGYFWLDVAIAKLASPEIDSIEGAKAIVAQAASLLEELQATTRSQLNNKPPAPDITALGKLLAAAAPVPVELAKLLPHCTVTITDAGVRIVVPRELVSAMKPHVPQLTTAAGRLGLPISVRQKQAPKQKQ
jgi:DNA polymerase III subunit gamma/tau